MSRHGAAHGSRKEPRSTGESRLIAVLDGATDLTTFERGVAEVFHLDGGGSLWGQLDSVQRALLLRLVSFRRPDIALSALQAAASLADIYEWAHHARSAHGTPGAEAPSMLRAGLVHVREWRQDDLPQLYRAATAPDQGRRWRLRGTTPSFREFASDFGVGTLATLVVATNADDVAVGTVAAYSPSLEHGWVYVGFQGIDPRSGIGLMFEGMLVFVTWLFDTWNLRKVYAEVSPSLFSHLRSLEPDPMQVEGRLVDHVYEQGSWHDVVILSMQRDRWMRFATSVSELVQFQAADPAG